MSPLDVELAEAVAEVFEDHATALAIALAVWASVAAVAVAAWWWAACP